MFNQLRNIHENKDVPSKDIEILLEKKLVSYESGTLNVSDKGYEYLDKYRVDNAVIMAAGFGSRFVPYSYHQPKGLLEVFGQPMVERQILQLKEVGIENIVVVVGHLAESFEYLKNKYNVKIVKNPDYKKINNISTIYHAQKHFKRTYLLTSDIYMPENIYHLYEKNSWYASCYFEGKTHEWGLKLDSRNKIIGINKSGNNDWVMYGPAFLDLEFSEQLIEEVNKVYSKDYSKDYYWEDIVRYNLEKFDLSIKKLKNESIIEFESIEELRVYDDSYLCNPRSEELSLIAKVFEVDQKDIVDIKPLNKGMTNSSFIFKVFDNRYVFRVPGKGTEQLISREEEALVYDTVSTLNISDELIYFNELTGYKITKYYNNIRELDINNKVEVTNALQVIKKLHDEKLSVDHEFSLYERIKHYEELCTEQGIIFDNQTKTLREKILELLNRVDTFKFEKVLCHIDPVSCNFLVFNEEKIKLIDWEYSGMAIPLLDIAMFALYENNTESEVNSYLEIYLGRKPSNEELFTYYSFIAASGYLWTLWTLYKESLGEFHSEYLEQQFRYARIYVKKAISFTNEGKP